VDGVLLVINPGKTPFHAALTTLEQMKRAGAHVVGVVMNRIPRNRAYYYGGYRYNSHYYQDHYSYSYDDRPRSKKPGLASLFKSRFGKSKKVTNESDTPIKTTDE
jgi:Mrp family chromosome partitioning ATPase